MFASIILSGGDGVNQFSYDLMASSSSVMLEKGTWRDEVATPNTSLLNPRPYNDCVVSCSVTIFGTSELDAWTKYNEFAALLQQIAVQPINPAYNPIVLKMRVSDTSPIYQAKILGSPDRNPQTAIVAPAANAFQDSDSMWMIRNVGLSFLREGLYRGDDSTIDTASVAYGAASVVYYDPSYVDWAVMTLTFPENETTKAPIELFFKVDNPNLRKPNGHLIVASHHDESWYYPPIQVVPVATKVPTGGTFSTLATTGQVNPFSSLFGASFFQWQATSNAAVATTGNISSHRLRLPKTALILGLLRSDIANSEAIVSLSFRHADSGTALIVNSEAKSILGNANLYPQVVNFGVVAIPPDVAESLQSKPFYMTLNCQNVSAALSKIVFDAFIIVDVGANDVTYIMHGELPTATILLNEQFRCTIGYNAVSPFDPPFNQSRPSFLYGIRQPHHQYNAVYLTWITPYQTAWNSWILNTANSATSYLQARNRAGALVPRGDS